MNTLPTKQLNRYNNTLKEQTGLQLHPAGIWKFDENGKKSPINARRPDNASLEKFPKDNMFKIHIKDGSILVIDVDNRPREEVETLYPSIKDTLTTTTSTKEKAHYYLLPPEGKVWTATRATGIAGVDYLTNGTVFEGHLYNDPASQYSITDKSIKRATEEEFIVIESIFTSSYATTYKNDSLLPYANKEMLYLIKDYIDSKKPLEKEDQNRLCRSIMNEAYRKKNKGKRGRLAVELSYINMNTIAVKLSYNALISAEIRDEFIEKWLKQEWQIDRNSKETNQRLDKSILPSLPTNILPDPFEEDLTDRLYSTAIEGFALVKTIVDGTWKYIQIDPSKLTPRRIGRNDSYILSANAIGGLYEDGQIVEIAFELAQAVTIVDNPYKPVTYYDGESRIDYFNVARRTEYEREIHTSSTLPDNPLTRAIKSYFGEEHTTLYLYWLAHTTLAPNSPILIPFLVSSESDAGGSGKTLNATTIPTALAYAVSTISPQTMTSDWGDATSSSRLVALNDMPPMSDKDWATIYGKMRDETSQGMRRKKNMKYAGFVEVTDAYGISVSANWIPSLDIHDRRAWVVLPQHLEYGDTAPVSNEDAQWLDIFAQEHLHTRYEELSELMAYLRYLYEEHTDTYKEELYRKAPETKGRNMAIQKGTTYSSRIIYSIQTSPPTLWELMLEDDEQFNDELAPLSLSRETTATKQEIAKVIVMQYDNGKVFLPKDFLAEIQYRIANSDSIKHKEKHNTLAKISDSLGVDKEKFKQTAKQHHFSYERIKEFELPVRMANYPQRMIAITLAEPQLELWKEEAENGH